MKKVEQRGAVNVKSGRGGIDGILAGQANNIITRVARRVTALRTFILPSARTSSLHFRACVRVPFTHFSPHVPAAPEKNVSAWFSNA